MNIKPIRNDDDHTAALGRLEDIWDAQPGSKEADELEVLTLLISDYEDKHHAIELADPIDLLKFVMDQQELKQKDLIHIFGESGRVSEILNRKRPLTLKHIRKLVAMDLSADVLVREYEVAI